jgi:hypothetical protein
MGCHFCLQATACCRLHHMEDRAAKSDMWKCNVYKSSKLPEDEREREFIIETLKASIKLALGWYSIVLGVQAWRQLWWKKCIVPHTNIIGSPPLSTGTFTVTPGSQREQWHCFSRKPLEKKQYGYAYCLCEEKSIHYPNNCNIIQIATTVFSF